MTSRKKKAEDILTLIKADHKQVEALFKEIGSAKGAKKVQDCFDQIYQELTLHAQAEELVFYPAMREYEETEEYLEEAEEEHNDVKIMLEEMRRLDPSDAEFSAKIEELKEAVLHHVEEEENEIFEAVRECMEDEDLQDLGQEFYAAKERLAPDIKAVSSSK